MAGSLRPEYNRNPAGDVGSLLTLASKNSKDSFAQLGNASKVVLDHYAAKEEKARQDKLDQQKAELHALNMARTNQLMEQSNTEHGWKKDEQELLNNQRDFLRTGKYQKTNADGSVEDRSSYGLTDTDNINSAQRDMYQKATADTQVALGDEYVSGYEKVKNNPAALAEYEKKWANNPKVEELSDLYNNAFVGKNEKIDYRVQRLRDTGLFTPTQAKAEATAMSSGLTIDDVMKKNKEKMESYNKTAKETADQNKNFVNMLKLDTKKGKSSGSGASSGSNGSYNNTDMMKDLAGVVKGFKGDEGLPLIGTSSQRDFTEAADFTNTTAALVKKGVNPRDVPAFIKSAMDNAVIAGVDNTDGTAMGKYVKAVVLDSESLKTFLEDDKRSSSTAEEGSLAALYEKARKGDTAAQDKLYKMTTYTPGVAQTPEQTYQAKLDKFLKGQGTTTGKVSEEKNEKKLIKYKVDELNDKTKKKSSYASPTEEEFKKSLKKIKEEATINLTKEEEGKDIISKRKGDGYVAFTFKDGRVEKRYAHGAVEHYDPRSNNTNIVTSQTEVDDLSDKYASLNGSEKFFGVTADPSKQGLLNEYKAEKEAIKKMARNANEDPRLAIGADSNTQKAALESIKSATNAFIKPYSPTEVLTPFARAISDRIRPGAQGLGDFVESTTVGLVDKLRTAKDTDNIDSIKSEVRSKIADIDGQLKYVQYSSDERKALVDARLKLIRLLR